MSIRFSLSVAFSILLGVAVAVPPVVEPPPERNDPPVVEPPPESTGHLVKAYGLRQIDPPAYFKFDNEPVEPQPRRVHQLESDPVEPQPRSYLSILNINGFVEAQPEDSGLIQPASPKQATNACNSACGVRGGSNDKIVGGQDAEKNEYPWRCALYTRTSYFFFQVTNFICGCTVLSENWILTAAHCTVDTSARNLLVNAGAYNLSSKTEPNQVVPVAQKIVHENYNSRTFENDISLLRVSTPLKFGDNIQPACLPYNVNSEQLQDQTVEATGWGAEQEGARSTPDILHEVTLPLLNTTECQKYYKDGQVKPGMICTYAAGKDTCQGDSGGSIDFNNNGNFTTVGVVSWGYGCARENYPGVYTDVNKYLDWITSKTNSKFCG